MKGNKDLRKVGDYIMRLYGFKNIPLQYIDTLSEYRDNVRKIKIKINKDGKWPVSFSVFKKD